MNTHRVTEIQLLENDNGKRIVPLHTGKVQIGRCYTPKPTASDARWIEKHTKSKAYGLAFWIVFSCVSLAGVIVIAAGSQP
jgi:hypothetical protein